MRERHRPAAGQRGPVGADGRRTRVEQRRIAEHGEMRIGPALRGITQRLHGQLGPTPRVRQS